MPVVQDKMISVISKLGVNGVIWLLVVNLVFGYTRQVLRLPTNSLLCQNEESTCACGNKSLETFRITIPYCSNLLPDETENCFPCDGLSHSERCDNYKHCETCSDYLLHCESCSDNKYGAWCTKECQCKNEGHCLLNGDCVCNNVYSGKLCEVHVDEQSLNVMRYKREIKINGCDVPAHPNNGYIYRMVGIDSDYQVFFTCNPGYRLQGVYTITCSAENGTWSDDPPTCVPETLDFKLTQVVKSNVPTNCSCPVTAMQASEAPLLCERRIIPYHCTVYYHYPAGTDKNSFPEDKFPIGTHLKYVCNYQYQLDGANDSECLPNGQWNGSIPTCTQVCGIGQESKTPQIAGGIWAEAYEFPWLVAISIYRSAVEYRTISCGGVILNEFWVLTAAHCITKRNSKKPLETTDVKLFFGKHYYDVGLDDNTVESRQPKHLIVHEGYDPKTFDCDVGLIALSQELVYNERIIPHCLPDPESPWTDLVGQHGLVAGWGDTQEPQNQVPMMLKKVSLPVADPEKCKQNYQGSAMFGPTVTENMFCAGFDQGGHSTCSGDSGSPMTFFENGRNVLEGIVSWGNTQNCSAQGFYGAFVRLRNFVSWIKGRTKS